MAALTSGEDLMKSHGVAKSPRRPVALAAAVALFRYKRGVIEVIAGCAALGLLARLTLPM